MRILDKQAGRLHLSALGMDPNTEQRIAELFRKPHGIILVTGPTGSGKTTTLYAGLEHLNDNTQNIMTVEDPIEYYIDGIGQTQVNTKVEMTFARGLRAILRQDPDVVMVGEIRDLETAQIAVQASLTGHLVLSTLHTNTAVGALTRLRDMGIEPFLLSSSLIGVVAQRLVRTLNPDNKQAFEAGEYERRLLGLGPDDPSPTLYRPGPGPSGFRGRTGIYELVIVDDQMRTMIHDEAAEHELERYARTHDAVDPRRRPRARPARRNHGRRSPARHARGLTQRSTVGAFEYTALDTAGREQNGVVEGDTVKHVRQLLRERQLLPVTVAEVKHGEAKRDRSFTLRRGVSASDLSLLTRQLATLVKAGLPLEEALLAVSQQSEKPRVQSIMLGVRAKVMEGHTLADGFSGISEGVPRDLPLDGVRRRELRPPRRRARAPGRLHREPRGHAAEGARRDAVPHRPVDHLSRHRDRHDGLRGAEGDRGVRVEQGQAALRHPGADRRQRIPAQLGHLSRDRASLPPS